MKPDKRFNQSSPLESGGEARKARRGGSLRMLALTALWLVPLFLQSADAQTADKAIQDTWLASDAELAGRPYPDKIVKSMKLVIQENTYLVTVGEAPDRGTLKIVSSAKPKRMDILGTDGPNKGRTILAIYEQSGDTLRICYDLSGNTRPSAFKTEPGTQLFLVSYRRAPHR